MKLLVLTLVAVLVAGVAAECPNACNGHGVCGQHDLCTCHRNWGGNNCNYRICPFDRAFGDQVRGDFNMDGDRVDHVNLGVGHHFGALAPENIPSQQIYATSDNSANLVKYDNKDEGHFYAECSGRGSCDRKTGLCKCDDGFSGAACKRINCPNDCNGHGTCTLLGDLTSHTYTLWDHDKQQACTCDAGYTGVDCSYRTCPHGDDPLTWYYKTVQGEETGEVQRNEEQWLDVWKENEGGTDPTNTNVDATNSNANKAISGTIRLTYVDEYGETWTTRPITVGSFDSGSGTTYAQSVEDALEAIPNDVFEDVTVTAHLMEDPMPVSCQTGVVAKTGRLTCQRAGAADGVTFGAKLDDYFRCHNHQYTNGDNEGPQLNGKNTYCSAGVSSFGMAADWSVTRNGQRFWLEGLGQDPSNGNTYNATEGGTWTLGTTDAIEATSATPTATSADTYFQDWYISRVSNTGIRFKIKFVSNPGNINTLGCDVSGLTTTSRFAVNYCNAYSQQHFGPEANSAHASNNKATAFFVAGRDAYPGYTHASTCVNNTCIVNTLIDAKNNIVPGDRLRLVKTDGTTVDWHSDVTVTVRAVEAEYSAAAINGITKESAVACSTTSRSGEVASHMNYFGEACNSVYVYEEVTTLSTFGNATNVFDIANLTTAGGGAILYIDRDGTTENVECSHRGLCDSEAGECNCFKGYTDDNCDRQQALAA